MVHNDVNDNNIVVSSDFEKPEIKAIIDYGDAVYTAKINDLAVALAYGIMHKENPLEAAVHLTTGYHQNFELEDQELAILHCLVAARLVISVTKSALNKIAEPDNKYLLISEKPAWKLLKQWIQIDPNFAYYNFREACGFTANPLENTFKNWANNQKINVQDLFPSLKKQNCHNIDMSVGSTWLGNKESYQNNDSLKHKITLLQQQNKASLLSGGYLESRPIYSTDAFRIEGNNGPEYRSIHLGTDFWVQENTPLHAPLDGEVVSIYNNDADKDYGPTLILKHILEAGSFFYTLYGHLSLSSIPLLRQGQQIQKGQLIGYIGTAEENGNWCPHLHFQILLDRLNQLPQSNSGNNGHNFPGTSTPNNLTVYKSICPDPNLLFNEEGLNTVFSTAISEILSYRNTHLGKGLSVSYNTPLKILRGEGVYLIDHSGKKYLDTVNNVAHVGHEHPRVVAAGQAQMALLNTNTRYLNENINEFAKELLATFPEELSVVHFVNSGSEANELALRMVLATTKQKDIIASEIGYHGNTNGCIGISSYKFDGKGGNGAPEHTHIVPLADAFRGKYRGKETGPKYAAHIEEQIQNIQEKGRNVGAFICESIISCGGQIELPENFLKLAYESVRKAGGLCISDEVQVGCGRLGTAFWGFQLHNVIPDIVTIGKPLGNGHPLAAVVCTPAVANAFANGMEYFNTFGGNPVSCAIGTEVLRVVKEEKLQENALKTGAYLIKQLKELQKHFPIIGEVRGQGLFLGFELNGPELTPKPEQASYLANRMKDFGILMSTDGPDYNVLKIKPPIVFSIDNAKELINRLRTVFQEDFMQI